jgi:hypothetical protein
VSTPGLPHVDRRTFLKASATAGLAGSAGITLLPSPAAAATITVARSGSPRSLTPDFFGLNGNNVQERLSWDRDDLGAALSSLRPGLLRYPAGTIGNYWDWRAGWFQPNGPWPGQTHGQTGEVIAPFDNSLTRYQIGLQRSQADALFMLNMLTINGRLGTAADNNAMIQDQVQFLQAAASPPTSIAVRRVELGNEFYLSGHAPGPFGSAYSQRFPTATAYAQQANAWVTALRSAFPGVLIAAVGADATGNNSPRREGWNNGVLGTLSGVNALTLHPFIRVTNASATPQSLLALPYKRVQNLKGTEFPAIASRGLSAWITEFNLVDDTPDRIFAGTWTHGLFIAAYALMLAQVPTVSLIDLHNVVGDAMVGALFDSTDGFGTPTPATQFLARTAKGASFGVVLQASRGATSGQTLGFPGGPTLSGGAPGLVGMEFTGGAQRQVAVVNLTRNAHTLVVTSLFNGAFSWSRTSASSLTRRITGPSSLTVASGTATGQLNLPAHSVVRLSQ